MWEIFNVLFLGGWKKYLAIGAGAVVLAAGAYILWLRAENAQLALDVAQHRANFEQCQAVNKTTVDSFNRAKEDNAKAVRELSDELARKTAEKEKVKVVRQIIREKAQECVGVNPADRAAAEWLRGRATRPD